MRSAREAELDWSDPEIRTLTSKLAIEAHEDIKRRNNPQPEDAVSGEEWLEHLRDPEVKGDLSTPEDRIAWMAARIDAGREAGEGSDDALLI